MPGLLVQVFEHFRANMPAVHAEQGCIEYEPVIDVPDGGVIQDPLRADTFVVVEKWATLALLDDHAASSYMAAQGPKVKDLLASRTIRVLASVVESRIS